MKEGTNLPTQSLYSSRWWCTYCTAVKAAQCQILKIDDNIKTSYKPLPMYVNVLRMNMKRSLEHIHTYLHIQ